MTTPRLKISEFRRVVDSLNWSRNDLGGATSDEFIRMDIKTRLERHIQAVEALLPVVPARFSPDIERAHEAIDYARKCIARWADKVAASKVPKAGPVRIAPPVLYLVH